MVTDKADPRGGSLGGDGFTANAPMAAEARMHENSGSYWNQYIVLENTSDVPYFRERRGHHVARSVWRGRQPL